MSAKVISVINLKGGVAKTTTTVQLAECLADQFAKKVLVIDLDPQTNATVALIGEEKWDKLDRKNQTIYQLFKDKLDDTSKFDLGCQLQNPVSNLCLHGLSLLPSSIKFIDIQDRIPEIASKNDYVISPVKVLKQAICNYLNQYDYVLIDCPPNLGLITQNGIEISDYYLIPTIPDMLSIYGLPQIVKKIHYLSIARHLKIRCLGLIITKYQSNSNRHNNVKEYELPSRFKESFKKLGIDPAPIFQTIIPQANQTAEAIDFESRYKTFKEKYGYSKSGNKFLYEYVVDMTKEFIYYVNN